MSPNEAAELLGVSPAATRDEVERTYQARLAEAGADAQRRDALTAARDALVAASAWQPPYPQNAPTQPYPSQSAPAQPYPPQNAPTQPYPPQNAPTQPQPPFAPQQPYGAPPQTPSGGSYPGPAQGGYPPPGYPQQGYAQAGQSQAGQPQPGQPAPGYGPGAFGAYQGYPPPPPRKRMSTGAIVGITVGGIVGGLAILLVAVLVIASIGASASRIAQAESSSSASPYDSDPGDGSSDDPSEEPSDPGSGDSEVEDYDVDGVHVHYVDGWTFELTPGQTCAGATVTATFADTPEGETLDSWTTTVDFEAGVPYDLTIPDDASEYDYVGIESVQCGQA